MRLDFALRDFDECQDGPVIPPIIVRDQVFENEQIAVDNHCFVNCTFLNCRLWYAGGPVAFRECQIDAHIRIALTGAASRGHGLWERLKHPAGDDLTPEAT